MRTRLRDARSAQGEQEYYARVYPDGYRHDAWTDHVERVNASVEMLRGYADKFRIAADLSCGDGAILRGLLNNLDLAWFGDLNGVDFSWTDNLPATAGEVMEVPPALLPDSLDHLPEPVDLFILSETLEHMDDPDGLLRRLTDYSTYLFISTPENEPLDYGNLEHYWSWGRSDIAEMLNDTGWTPVERRLVDPSSTQGMDGRYVFQLWLAINRGA